MRTPLKKFASRFRRTPVVVTISADDERVVIAWSDREESCSFAWREVDERRGSGPEKEIGGCAARRAHQSTKAIKASAAQSAAE
jgi:hypothetical protein